MQELEILQQKLHQLIKSYLALAAERNTLQQKLHRQEQTLKQQAEQISQLEQRLQLKSVADAAAGTPDQAALKEHLDAVIKLIDQNIAKLK